jgi:hypothetical protein
MRKRLRKKCHLGEFREEGFNVSFSLSAANEDTFYDRFLTEAIETNGLICGGRCDAEWDIFVTKSRGSATEVDRTVILNWLEEQSTVKDILVGPLVDAWWGW